MSASSQTQWPLYWGVLGFVAILGNAIVKLSAVAAEAFQYSFDSVQWAFLCSYTLFMVYSEGYKGFHRMTAPRVVARGIALSSLRGRPLWRVLAPAFCMGLIGATRKRLVISWTIVLMIVGLVIGVRLLPQPWRGIVDIGVVAGLAMGTISTLYFFVRALGGRQPDIDSDLPADFIDPE